MRINSLNPIHNNYNSTIEATVEVGLKIANIVMLCECSSWVYKTDIVEGRGWGTSLYKASLDFIQLQCFTLWDYVLWVLSTVQCCINLLLFAPTFELRNMICTVENTFVLVNLHIWRSWTLRMSGKVFNSSLRSACMLMVSGIVCSKMELDSFTESETEKLFTYHSFKQISYSMYS
jgi:hypothetical protein